MNVEAKFYEPTVLDLERLRPMARQAFADTFAHLYDEIPFAHFLDAAYGPNGRLARDFADPAVQWRVASIDGVIIGYAKLTPLRAPAPAPEAGAVELEQLYVSRDWHGSGVADHLMEWAIGMAHAQSSPELYLTVFDHNTRAKRFYARHGFSEVGRCTFALGDRIDDDRIWYKPLRSDQ